MKHDRCHACGSTLVVDPFGGVDADLICPLCDAGQSMSATLPDVCRCGRTVPECEGAICADDPNEYNRALPGNDGEERRELAEDDWREDR